MIDYNNYHKNNGKPTEKSLYEKLKVERQTETDRDGLFFISVLLIIMSVFLLYIFISSLWL